MIMSKILKNKSSNTPAPIGPKLKFASQEAYNLLRINLSFSLPDNEGKTKIIGVTSSSPKEGKSYTAINLAYTLAEAKSKVLLIDTDLRRPTIAKQLEIAQSPGLSNFLAGQTEKVAHKNVLSPNLWVITAGDIPPNPSELISSKAMVDMLDKFSNLFDYIIMDLPPVNAVADPIALAPKIDGVIVVVRHGRTKRGEILEAVRQIEFSKANILGFVYNGMFAEHARYRSRGKYYYHGNYYRYDNSSAKRKTSAEPEDQTESELTEL